MNVCLGILLLSLFCCTAAAQVEMNGWGELRGIRVDGELVPVSTRITVVGKNWGGLAQTAHWRTQDQGFSRESGAIVSTGKIVGITAVAPLSFKQVVTDVDSTTCRLDVTLNAAEVLGIEGVYLFLGVPADRFGNGTAELIDPAGAAPAQITFGARPSNGHFGFGEARGVRIEAHGRSVELKPERESPATIVLRDDRASELKQVTAFLPIHLGDLEAGETVTQSFTIRVAGAADQSPAHVTIDRADTGAVWEGIGGNFCWGTQSSVVPFYLEHLNLAWARVNFPWNEWQPDADTKPGEIALENQPESIRECIRIARELHRRGIPMMVSIWNAPDWAQRPREQNGSAQQFGRTARLDSSKTDAIATSIVAYLQFFKREVGVEPALFSFNEPNLGINVLQSPQEHAQDIKRLGSAFERAGLMTKLLLGDANEPRAVNYVAPALDDAQAMRYVGAISVHSWNDGTDEQLLGWREHARRAGLPLYVAEAGHDPDAHRYRAILDETWYAIDEAELNLRCINLMRAATLMHWQLTPDYGLVHESGDGKLQETQRWFEYSQLDRFTPRGAKIITATSDVRAVTAAALSKDKSVIVHLTNRDAARPIVLSGIDAQVSSIRAYLTDATHQQTPFVAVDSTEGALRLTMPAQSMLTLVIENK